MHHAPTASVVVAVDASPASGRALDWAAARAARGHLPLLIVATTDVHEGTSAEGLLRGARERVAGLAPELPVTQGISPGNPVALLLAASRTASVVVVGHDGVGSSGRLATSSVATDLVAAARCPVVVVKDVDDPLRPRVGVVVGVDGSAASASAVAFAFAEAEILGTGVDVVHAREGGRDQGPSAVLRDVAAPHYQLEQRGRLWLSESLAGVLEQHPDVEVTRVVAAGDPVHVLLARSDGALLLVVGSHDRGTLSRLVLGSVGRELVRRAAAPVAVVRPHTFGGT